MRNLTALTLGTLCAYEIYFTGLLWDVHSSWYPDDVFTTNVIDKVGIWNYDNELVSWGLFKLPGVLT